MSDAIRDGGGVVGPRDVTEYERMKARKDALVAAEIARHHQEAIDALKNTLPSSLRGSLELFMESPDEWHAEWQRMHDFKVNLLNAKRAADQDVARLTERIQEACEALERERAEYGDPIIVISKQNPALATALMAIGKALGILRGAPVMCKCGHAITDHLGDGIGLCEEDGCQCDAFEAKP